MKKQRAVCTAVTIATIAVGCQHIPPEPLRHQDIVANIQLREIDIEPIHDFAKSLVVGLGDRAEFDVSDGISLREAKAIALWYNIDVREARLMVDGAERIVDAAGRWPDPEVGVSGGRKREKSGDSQTITIEDPNQTVSFTDEAGDIERTWVDAASLTITIPLSGRYGAQKKLRQAQHDTAVLNAIETEWRVLRDFEIEWLEWSILNARYDLLEDHISDLRAITESAEALAAAGELLPANARVMRIGLMRYMAQRDRMSYEISARRGEIMSHMGLAADAGVELVPRAETDDNIDSDRDMDEAHPSMAKVLGEYEIAERALRLELRKQYPDITLTPNYSDEDSETAFVIGMGIPVPVWNRNQEGIAEAVAKRDRARIQAERVYQYLMTDLRSATKAYDGADSQWRQLTMATADLLDRQIEETQALLRFGEFDITNIHAVMDQVLETKNEILDAFLARNIAAVKVRAATAPDRVLPTPQPETAP